MATMKLSVLLVTSFAALVSSDEPSYKYSVKIGNKTILGERTRATDGTHYVVYRNIRFARPPVGDMRFTPAVCADGLSLHDDVTDATKPGVSCPQYTDELGQPLNHKDRTSMSEDCLYLNVMVPLGETDKSEPKDDIIRLKCPGLKPTMTFVPGGSYISGSGHIYEGGYLMTRDLVLVTLNYRLGPLGFLSMANDLIPGNAALTDVICAANWVKQNIHHFCGDPYDVTLAGHSAGAFIAHFVSLSKWTEGFFKRLILLSGTALSNAHTLSPIGAKIALTHFLAELKISTFQTPKAIFKALNRVPIEEIINAFQRTQAKIGPSIMVPVIDHRVVMEDPETSIKKGKGKDTPILLGITDNECSSFARMVERIGIIKLIQKLPIMILPRQLWFSSNMLTIPAMISMVSNRYFVNNVPTIEGLMQWCSSTLYEYPMMRFIDLRLNSGANDTRVYRFGYQANYSDYKNLIGTTNDTGAGHSEDITYIFNFNYTKYKTGNDEERQEVNKMTATDDDSKMTKIMTNSMADYVIKGDPGWPTINKNLLFQCIYGPDDCISCPPTNKMTEEKQFYDRLYQIGRSGAQLFR